MAGILLFKARDCQDLPFLVDTSARQGTACMVAVEGGGIYCPLQEGGTIPLSFHGPHPPQSRRGSGHAFTAEDLERS